MTASRQKLGLVAPGHPKRPTAVLRHLNERSTTSNIYLAARRLNLDVDTCRQTQFVKRFNRLGRRLNNVDQPLVRTNLKLLTSLLINMRTRQHRVPLDSRRQRDGTVNFRSCPLGRIDDIRSTLV